MVKGALSRLGGMGGGLASDVAYGQQIRLQTHGVPPVGLPAGLMAGMDVAPSPKEGVPGLGPWPKAGTAITALQTGQLMKWLTAMSWNQWRGAANQYIYLLYDKYGKITNAKADMVWIDDFIDQSFANVPFKGGINEAKMVPFTGPDSDQKLYYAIVEKLAGPPVSTDSGPDGSGTDLNLTDNTNTSPDAAPAMGPFGLPWLWWGVAGGLGVYLWSQRGSKVA